MIFLPSQNVDNSPLGICNLSPGEEHVLTFSDCHPDKFTCSDGSCLPLERKCDSVVDCSDGSDEDECEFLVMREDYEKDKLPVKENKKPLEVKL